jgi:hypothetical protein
MAVARPKRFPICRYALEPVVVTHGATMMADTLSLLVCAICVPLYANRASSPGGHGSELELRRIRRVAAESSGDRSFLKVSPMP